MQTARRWEDVADLILLTGLDNIDGDHRHLTEIALQLNNLVMTTGSMEFSLDLIQGEREVLENTLDYARHHFRREERLIALFNLPNAARQQRQHQEFTRMIEEAIQEFNAGKLTVGLNLKGWILDWWITHINEVDAQTFGLDEWHLKAIHGTADWSALSEIVFPTRIETLDDEHRELSELLLRLIQDRAARDAMSEHFGALRQLAMDHFTHEETLIERYDLPGLATQRSQHLLFLEMLSEGVASQDSDEVEEVLRQILNWWVKHINEVDRMSFSREALEEKVFMVARSWTEFSVFVRTVGHDVIDHDHERITEAILKLENVMSAASGDKAAGRACQEILGEVLRRSEEHFESEHELMQTMGSALYKLHADSHAKFVHMMNDTMRDLGQGRLAVSRNIKREILAWWVHHINDFDYPTFGGSHAAREETHGART